VGGLDDHRTGGLAEDPGEAHDRDRAAVDEVGERLSGADRRKLVDVADEHQAALRR